MDGIYVATLRKSEPSPFVPRSDEGAVTTKKAATPKPWKPGAISAIRIDLDGLMARAVPLPIPAADIDSLDARGDKIFYMTTPPQTISGPLPGQNSKLHVYDLAKRKDGTVV